MGSRAGLWVLFPPVLAMRPRPGAQTAAAVRSGGSGSSSGPCLCTQKRRTSQHTHPNSAYSTLDSTVYFQLERRTCEAAPRGATRCAPQRGRRQSGRRQQTTAGTRDGLSVFLPLPPTQLQATRHDTIRTTHHVPHPQQLVQRRRTGKQTQDERERVDAGRDASALEVVEQVNVELQRREPTVSLNNRTL